MPTDSANRRFQVSRSASKTSLSTRGGRRPRRLPGKCGKRSGEYGKEGRKGRQHAGCGVGGWPVGGWLLGWLAGWLAGAGAGRGPRPSQDPQSMARRESAEHNEAKQPVKTQRCSACEQNLGHARQSGTMGKAWGRTKTRGAWQHPFPAPLSAAALRIRPAPRPPPPPLRTSTSSEAKGPSKSCQLTGRRQEEIPAGNTGPPRTQMNAKLRNTDWGTGVGRSVRYPDRFGCSWDAAKSRACRSQPQCRTRPLRCHPSSGQSRSSGCPRGSARSQRSRPDSGRGATGRGGSRRGAGR